MPPKRKRAAPTKRASTRKRSKTEDDDDEEEEEEDDWDSNEDEDEEEEEAKSTPAATPTRRSSRTAATKATKKLAKVSRKEKEAEEEEEDEETGEASSSKAEEPEYVAPDTLGWGKAGGGTLYVLYGKDIKPSTKIASFDMDDTLITTKSGRTFATGRSDWKFLFPSIPEKLKEFNEKGFNIVIFTNQAGVGKGKVRVQDVKGKIDDIREALGIPVIALMATDEDEWRKPQPNMWHFFIKELNGGVDVDLDESFYCGDAAGRAAAWDGNKKTKKDFSCSDRKFAFNSGIPFKTPEAFFLDHEEAPFSWGGVNPAEVPKDTPLCDHPETLTSGSQEMIILVGYAASGKSTFARTHLVPKGYVHVNQDTLKNKANCLKAAAAAIKEGKSVVIDNTNPSASTRAEYIERAGDVPVRCFVFSTPLELAQHLNVYREKRFGVKHVPGVGYNMYKKNFKAPSLDEGFTEIRTINFKPSFASPEDEKVFLQFT